VINPFFKNTGPFNIENLLSKISIQNTDNYKKDKIFDIKDLTTATKKDLTFLEEYISATTSTGTPKYYAMLDTGATGESSSNSGSIIVSPTPSATFAYKIHYNAAPALLENDDTNYISMNFPNGLLYCCLAETYGFLKGPADMLQLYEQKYQQEVQKFGGEQIGRRRRDDYTDGTVRIPVPSQTP